jgi:tetratricopeptide (TPR) repeat protein
MKRTFLIVTALLMTVMVYSQRQELREASRSINNKDFNSAKQALSKIEGQIASQDASTQAEFYLYKGQAYLGAAGNREQDLLTAAEAFKKVIELEESGRQRHTKQASDEIQALLVRLVNSAIQDQNAQRFSAASKKLYSGYTISKTDTVYLYFAATNAMSAQEYDNAMKYYEELMDLGYTGIEKEYVATDRETGEIVVFGNKEEQNLMMMSGEYIRPQERMSESRRPVILRDLGLVYIERGKTEQAKQLIADARKNDPNDVSLIRAEANIALQMDDMKAYNSLMQKVIASDPDNPEIYYNLGVSSASIGDKENAKKYYNQALKLDPNFHNAQVNLAVLILEKEDALIEEMNSLGTSAADNRRYDELRKQRDDMYREAIPYLESALKGRPNDIDIMRTLMNMYSILGDDTKFKNMRERIESQEN